MRSAKARSTMLPPMGQELEGSSKQAQMCMSQNHVCESVCVHVHVRVRVCRREGVCRLLSCFAHAGARMCTMCRGVLRHAAAALPCALWPQMLKECIHQGLACPPAC